MKTVKISKINLIAIASVIFFSLSVWSASAQRMQKPKNELSIDVGGGWAAFHLQPSVDNASSGGYSVDAGGGFTGFLSPHWGLHVGAGIGIFNVKNKVNQFSFITNDQVDCEGYLNDLYTTLNEYKETHQAFFLRIPLMLQFQTKMGQSFHWKKQQKVGYYAMAGVKAQFLVNYRYTAEIASLYNKAYYPDFNNWIDLQPALGLGAFDGNSASGKLDFNILAMLALETGAKWRLNDHIFLYTGIYFDYGLNDPTQKSRKPYSNYNTPEELENLTLLAYTDRMHLMEAGIKLRFAFTRYSRPLGCPAFN